MKVSSQTCDGIAVITFSNPPVNALAAGNGMVAQLHTELEAAAKDASISAIVLAGEGKLFSAGADIAEFESNPRPSAESIRNLITLLDSIEKPTVAALHGMSLGGGMEVALATTARIASEGTRLGLPEVTLGLLPGGGGTQRLPRLIGVDNALDMMLTGKTITAGEAQTLGLVDRVTSGNLTDEAIRLAQELVAESPRRQQASARTIAPAERTAIDKARENIDSKGGKLLARQLILDCVEAAMNLPFTEGFELEGQKFEVLRLSEQSRGLRHSFFAERAVGKIPNLDSGKGLPVETAAVIGAGTMGTGITISLLNANIPVTLIERNPQALERSVGTIEKTINGLAEKKRISAEQAKHQLSLLTATQDMEKAGEADIIIEAVFENMEVKRSIFVELDRIAKPSAILASNTSMLDVNVIAGFTSRPENVLGTHFFSPANIMRLLEIIRGDKTSAETLLTALEFARRIRKVGVVSGVCDGFIGNRMFEEMQRQAYLLLEIGAFPEQVDRALENWGMAMGTLRVMDLAGNDIGLANRQRRAVDQPDRPYSKIPDIIAEQGRYGQKTGAGFYLYPNGSRKPEVDPAIHTLILDYCEANGITRREVTDQEIVERCIYALINEGAKIIDEGIAYRPLDIDAVWTNGYGFPAHRGGPMLWADEIGLPRILEKIRQFEQGEAGWAWKPAKLLVDFAERNENFSSLNG